MYNICSILYSAFLLLSFTYLQHIKRRTNSKKSMDIFRNLDCNQCIGILRKDVFSIHSHRTQYNQLFICPIRHNQTNIFVTFLFLTLAEYDISVSNRIYICQHSKCHHSCTSCNQTVHYTVPTKLSPDMAYVHKPSFFFLKCPF